MSINEAPFFTMSDGDGIVVTSLGSGQYQSATSILLPDGKILAGGGNGFGLARYHPDGSLDLTFGNSGKVIVSSSPAATSFTIQSDGKIVVVGEVYIEPGRDFGVARYNTDGSVDTSFGLNGKLSTDVLREDFATSVAIQADGKIVVAGYSKPNITDIGKQYFSLTRYNPNGSLDPTFGTGGKVTTLLGDNATNRSMLIQADGKILVAGDADTNSAILRYNANGSLDSSFGVNGKVITPVGPFNDSIYSITQQLDGKIIAVGDGTGNHSMVRYNIDGSLDSGFGNSGIVITNVGSTVGGGYDRAHSVALQSDGKIVVAGFVDVQNVEDFSVVRYNADGSLDITFSGDGKVATAIRSGGRDVAYSVIAQPDGKILVTGTSEVSGNTQLVLVRYNPDGSLDSAFDSHIVQEIPNYVENGTAVTLNPDAQVFDYELFALDNYDGASLTLTRVGGGNEADSFSAKAGGTLAAFAQGGALKANGIVVGTVTQNSHGILELTFNNNATHNLVNSVIQQIAYSNNSEAPDSAAYISWTFEDGNTGSQGTGGALNAVTSTTVKITTVNDAPTFIVGDGVVLTTTLDSTNNFPTASAIQADGKVLLAGYSWSPYTFTLVRYNADGSLDNSFSGDGKLTTKIGTGFDNAYAVAVQSDGKVLLAGISSGIDSNIVVVRYNSDGTLDNSFDSDGKFIANFASYSLGINGIIVQPDGKILFAGTINNQFTLVRFNNDGSLDSSFDNDGILTIYIGATPEDGPPVKGFVLQQDGKIVVVGQSLIDDASVLVLARYNADGSIDSTFSDDGALTASFSSSNGLTIQSDGKILVAADSLGEDSKFALARYHSDGSLDESFGIGGKLITDFGTNVRTNTALQTDGKILVCGSINGDFAVTRYNVDGSLDFTFNGDGRVVTDIENGNDAAVSILVQADGKILLSGSNFSTSVGIKTNFALARYNADGSLDTRFDLSNTLNDSIAYIENATPVVLDSDAQIYDADLATINNYSGSSLTLARHGSASTQDYFSAKLGGTLGELIQGDVLTVGGVNIGIVTSNSAGTLTLNFNGNATQPLVNSALQQISYSNSSNTPLSSVQIDWIFNDGNLGAQGSGGSLSVSGNSIVNITAVNDLPTLTGLKALLANGKEDTSYAISKAQLLAGYTDADGDTLSIANLTADHGTIINNNNGTFTLIPAYNYNGLMNLSYQVIDGAGGSADAAQSLSLVAVADPLVTVTTSYLTLQSINAAADEISSTSAFIESLSEGTSAISDLGNAFINTQTPNQITGNFSGGSFVFNGSNLTSFPAKVTSAVFNLTTGFVVGVVGDITYANENADGTGVITQISVRDSNSRIVISTNSNIASDNLANITSLKLETLHLVNGKLVTDTALTVSGSFIEDENSESGFIGNVSSYTLISGGKAISVSGLKMSFSEFDRFDNFSDLLAATLGGNDVVNGTAASETLFGFDGNDNLKGLAGSDTLDGGDGNDLVDGGAGADSMSGGSGDDVYTVDNLNDVVVELPDEGIDTVRVNIPTVDGTYVLGDNLENATIISAVKYNVDGNELRNYLTGNAAINTLRGFEEDDTIDGGVGKDILIGGIGDDSYIVDAIGNANTGLGGDIITEVDGEGNDTVITKFSANLNSLQFANIENLTLFGTAILNATGNAGDNILTGNIAANILDGGAGIDTLIGGKGNDIYIVDSTTDIINELAAEGTDTILSSVSFDLTDTDGAGDNGGNIENLTLTGTDAINATGNALANKLSGNAGNNVLDGAAGIDVLIGGVGDDTYKVDLKLTGTGQNVIGSLQDAIGELANQGNDTVELRGGAGLTKLSAIALGANLENLDVSATASALLNLIGNTLNNTIRGNAAANKIDGGSGDDTIFGNQGNDTLIGGLGNDNLSGGEANDSLDGGAGNDTLTGGAGIDTLAGGAGNDVYLLDVVGEDAIAEAAGVAGGMDTIKIASTYDLTTNANVENLTLSGSSDINGTGNNLANFITGNSGFNILTGGLGNDTLDGGSGSGDSLVGGSGNDTYIVDDLTDTIVEEAVVGVDTIYSTVSLGLAFYENIENLTLAGGDNINATGSDGANVLTGNDGNNQLTGGDGVDTLKGGKGDDTYFVKLVQVGTDPLKATVKLEDIITENLNEGFDEINLIGDFSSLTTASTLILGANIEALRLDSLSTNATKLNITGNSLNNNFVGNGVANKIDGGAGNDTIYGGAGNDIIVGGTGNDDLLGNEGVDSLLGGAGNDRYYIDLVQVGDAVQLEDFVIEAASAGTDEISLHGTFNLGVATTISLGANVENLTVAQAVDTKLNLTGNILNNQLIGNNLANVLDGGTGNDVLYGNEGEDTVIGGLGNDNLNGNEGDDSLEGGAGNDTLDGDTGIDTLIGGLGNDIYILDDIDDVSEDVITEQLAGGIDTVKTSFSYMALAANVENLILIGSDDIDATGNELNNVITGNAANNHLNGGLGNDSLIGGAGDDTLDGGAGIDTLIGGIGNDTYVIDLKTLGVNPVASLQDLIAEAAGVVGGIDTLELRGNPALTTASNIALLAGLENLNAAPTGATLLNLNGNSLANIIIGNNANNVIRGGLGNDSLLGGAGNDDLWGDGGDDSMDGGEGIDFYVVDTINDVVIDTGVSDEFYLDTVFVSGNFSVDLEIKEYVGIEYIQMQGTQNLSLKGDALANKLGGNEGANFIEGRDGSDELLGGGGNDILNGGDGNDYLWGELNSFSELANNTSKDRLIGDAGNDTLVGGAGADTLTGGADADTFVYTSITQSQVGATTRDVITDFTRGEDVIDLQGIDAIRATPDNEAFTLIDGQFTKVAGQLRFEASSNSVFGDTNGDGVADFQIVLIGITTVSADDFIL